MIILPLEPLEWQYDLDESQPETRSVKEGLLGPKTKIRLLGAWNVRTMYETSKTAEVLGEMKRRDLDILGIRECRWTGSGPALDRLVMNDRWVVLSSGHENSYTWCCHGTLKEKAGSLLEWEPVLRMEHTFIQQLCGFQQNLKTKVQIYKSNVKSTLLYGSECWRVVKANVKKDGAFNNGCLICRIFWPNKISHHELYSRIRSRNITKEIKQRRLRWLGHVPRLEQNHIPKMYLRWTPSG